MHRACFTAWSERGAFTRTQFDLFAESAKGTAVALFYRSDVLAAAVAPNAETPRQSDVHLRHVDALDHVVVSLAVWPDWLARRGPTWAECAHPDDLILFSAAQAALRMSFPTADSILATTVVVASFTRIDDERRRDAARAQAIRDANVRARALATGPHRVACPHCASMLDNARFVDPGDERHAYFICQSCGGSVEPRHL
ncbi:MAG TPA: hypothetical protein VF403_12300 [Kofleriaceae bacterium]